MYGRCVAVRRSVLPATRPIRGAAGICLAVALPMGRCRAGRRAPRELCVPFGSQRPRVG